MPVLQQSMKAQREADLNALDSLLLDTIYRFLKRSTLSMKDAISVVRGLADSLEEQAKGQTPSAT